MKVKGETHVELEANAVKLDKIAMKFEMKVSEFPGYQGMERKVSVNFDYEIAVTFLGAENYQNFLKSKIEIGITVTDFMSTEVLSLCDGDVDTETFVTDQILSKRMVETTEQENRVLDEIGAHKTVDHENRILDEIGARKRRGRSKLEQEFEDTATSFSHGMRGYRR